MKNKGGSSCPAVEAAADAAAEVAGGAAGTPACSGSELAGAASAGAAAGPGAAAAPASAAGGCAPRAGNGTSFVPEVAAATAPTSAAICRGGLAVVAGAGAGARRAAGGGGGGGGAAPKAAPSAARQARGFQRADSSLAARKAQSKIFCTLSVDEDLETFLEEHPYMAGYAPSAKDQELYIQFCESSGAPDTPNLHRWFEHIASFPPGVRSSWPQNGH